MKILIIVFCISIFLTMNYIKNNNNTSNNNMPSMNNNGNNMMPPGNDSLDNDGTTPSMPNGTSENMNEQPEKPSGEDNKNNNIDFNGYKLYVNGVAIN